MKLKNIFAISIISAILLLGASAHFDLLEGGWLIFIISTLLSLSIATFLFYGEKSVFIFIIVFLILLVHIHSIIVVSNCFFDRSEPIEILQEEVVSKNFKEPIRPENKNKSTLYYVNLNGEEIKRVKVSRNMYHNLNKGDLIKIYIKKGLFGIRWYYIEDGLYR